MSIRSGDRRRAWTGSGLALSLGILLPAVASAELPYAFGREINLSRPQWKLFISGDYAPPADKAIDLLVHFHGDPQTIWNNAANAELNVVIVTINYRGLSSAYSDPFSDDTLFQRLLDDALNRLRRQPDFGSATSWNKLAVSSFSAGYGAVRRLLATPAYFEAIDGLLAADSLYATTAADGTPLDAQMADYKRFASQAAAGKKRFIFTHSQVPTIGYESTVETGDELLRHLGLEPELITKRKLGPVNCYRQAQQKGFKLWGMTGTTGEDHLYHLRNIGEWLGDLGLSRSQ
ncbi:MAG: hypothetical protein AAGF31_01120 [Planctomycetota bacterium]